MEEASGPPIEVNPDNLSTVNVFVAMSTQWRRAGIDGIHVGLDYAALPAVLNMVGVKRAEWPEVFSGIRIMEDAALKQLRELNSQKR